MVNENSVSGSAVDLAVTEQDWNDAAREWRAAGEAAVTALNAITWPAPDLSRLDAWLAAVERQNIAKVRLAALCELQWQKS